MFWNQFSEVPLPTNFTTTKGTIPAFDGIFKQSKYLADLWYGREFQFLGP